MYNNRKYVELNEEGILKRIEDIKKDLKLVGVQTKGLTTSLEAMEALLKIDIPKLRIEINKERARIISKMKNSDIRSGSRRKPVKTAQFELTCEDEYDYQSTSEN